jgi:hypothetical protein
MPERNAHTLHRVGKIALHPVQVAVPQRAILPTLPAGAPKDDISTQHLRNDPLATSLTSSFEKLAIGSAAYDARGLALDHHSHPSARRYTKRAAEGRRHVSVT